MKKSEISKTFYQKLICKLYVLGAPSEGESILFVVYGDEQIIYSCITDSFTMDKTNIPILITEQCDIDHVTDVFWTHPHDDHSDGLVEIIDKYEPEYVYIPSDLQTLPDDTPELSKVVLEKINQYHSCDKRYNYQPIIVDIGTNHIVLEKILNVAGKKVPFSIYTVAPAIGKVRRDVITDNFNKINDFSLAISISIGDFSILLTGDIQDQMIYYVYNDLQRKIDTPNLLKIPHHGSKGSLSVISLFDNDTKVDVAVTTSKKTSRLPKKEALDFYSMYCNRIYKIGYEDELVGIWGVEIDILNATVTVLETQNYVIHTSA